MIYSSPYFKISKMFKIIIIISLFFNSFFVFGQSLDIKILTGITLLKKDSVQIDTAFSDIENERFSSVNFDVYYYGEIEIEHYKNDSIAIKIGQYMPLVIKGLNKIKSSTLIISNFPLTSYTPIDSLSECYVRYFMLFGKMIKLREINKETTPMNSLNFIKNATEVYVTINDSVYKPVIFSAEYNLITWACNSGKSFFNRTIQGVNKHYVIIL